MASKKDREKLQAERHQLIIQELLRDEDNKYCVDCDAKGPRWASWNIGVFLCIRCAGIHRNLGVHISKVKSVNLDMWTLTQLAMMRDMGNSRARAVYEARLPENFRRPQADAALENFIRAKYEQKRYIALEYVPTQPDVESLLKEIHRLEQANKKQRHTTTAVSLNPLSRPVVSSKHSSSKLSAVNSKTHESDLLGLNAAPIAPEPLNQSTDILSKLDDLDTASIDQKDGATASCDLAGLCIGGSATFSVNPPTGTTQGSVNSSVGESAGPKASKDAILALYQQPICGANIGLQGCSSTFNDMSGIDYFGSNSLRNPSCPTYQKSDVSSFADLQTRQRIPTTMGSVTCPQTNFSFPAAVVHQQSQNPGVVSDFALRPTFPAVTSGWALMDQNTAQPVFGNKPVVGPAFIPAGSWTETFRSSNPEMGNQMGPAYPTSGCFVPATLNPSSEAHLAYLSRVQNQLAALQLSGTKGPE